MTGRLRPRRRTTIEVTVDSEDSSAENYGALQQDGEDGGRRAFEQQIACVHPNEREDDGWLSVSFLVCAAF